MKSIRVLFALSVFAACASMASADCGTCEKKDQCTKADSTTAATCDKPKMACCEEAAKAGKVCEKCNPPAKMTCCEEAAKAGKVCEKCHPPASK